MQPLSTSRSPCAEGVSPLLQTGLGQEELTRSSRPAGSQAQAGGLFVQLSLQHAAEWPIKPCSRGSHSCLMGLEM